MNHLNVKPQDWANIGKFKNPDVTATGERRAHVALDALRTLWFNTGTLCNLTCVDCYIESSPTNDRLVYLSQAEVAAFLDEIDTQAPPVREIGFTGGEPFMNPDILGMLEDALSRGYNVLVLTNAMRPMMKGADGLKLLNARYPEKLTIRVSLDHYAQPLHDISRGAQSWEKALMGLRWLRDEGFAIDVAGRTCWSESEARKSVV